MIKKLKVLIEHLILLLPLPSLLVALSISVFCLFLYLLYFVYFVCVYHALVSCLLIYFFYNLLYLHLLSVFFLQCLVPCLLHLYLVCLNQLSASSASSIACFICICCLCLFCIIWYFVRSICICYISVSYCLFAFSITCSIYIYY